jgi:hypothetical protein
MICTVGSGIANLIICPPLFGRTQSSNDSERGKLFGTIDERRDPHPDRGVLIVRA